MAPVHNVLGEREIDRWFERNEHLVVNPQHLGVNEKFRAYMSSQRLVFCDGFALHGLRLLGRNVSDMTVIRWIPDAPGYQALLASFCLSNREVDAVRATTTIGGRPAGAGAKALLDPQRLARDLGIAPADGRFPVPFRHSRFMIRGVVDRSCSGQTGRRLRSVWHDVPIRGVVMPAAGPEESRRRAVSIVVDGGTCREVREGSRDRGVNLCIDTDRACRPASGPGERDPPCERDISIDRRVQQPSVPPVDTRLVGYC
jgi:hypothetical protein